MVEIGFCKCGCGLPAPVAPYTYSKRGIRKGDPLDFVHGHNRRAQKHYEINPVTGCWEWLLGKTGKGYGSLNNKLAHIMYYEKHKGPVPDGLQLDHLCRNKICVNPDHLEPVTAQENIRRRDIAMGRLKVVKS